MHMSERNHEVIKSQQLLDEYGNIAEPGWSRKQLQQYSRTQIKGYILPCFAYWCKCRHDICTE